MKITGKRKHIGEADIYSLPDDTYFYVNNGQWMGFVTTEDCKKVCYSGVRLGSPKTEFVRRFAIFPGSINDIDIIEIRRKQTLDEGALARIELYLNDIEETFSLYTKSQDDDFASGLRLVSAIKDELELSPELDDLDVEVER